MKIKVLFFVCLLIVVGCQNDEYTEKKLAKARKEAKKIKKYNDTGNIREIRTFEYQGHEYISFEGPGVTSGLAVVHNPECKYCN